MKITKALLVGVVGASQFTSIAAEEAKSVPIAYQFCALAADGSVVTRTSQEDTSARVGGKYELHYNDQDVISYLYEVCATIDGKSVQLDADFGGSRFISPGSLGSIFEVDVPSSAEDLKECTINPSKPCEDVLGDMFLSRVLKDDDMPSGAPTALTIEQNQGDGVPSAQPTVDQDCEDLINVKFYVEYLDMEKDCIWLSGRKEDIEKLCSNTTHPAYHICEDTCGKCIDPCQDNPDFKMNFTSPGGHEWFDIDCLKFSDLIRDIPNVCELHREIRDNCKDVCNSCTQAPSSFPSESPSMAPSISSAPTITASPTPAPSSAPSATPTKSMAPSAAPSKAPTAEIVQVSGQTCYARSINENTRTCFKNLGLNMVRWGWTHFYSGSFTEKLELWCGAVTGPTDCGITNSALAGYVDVAYDGTTATVKFDTTESGTTLLTTNVYVGTNVLPLDGDGKKSSNPVNYPYNNDSPEANVDEATFTVSGNVIYVIAHAAT